jgi:hypothetical protein
MEVIINDFEVSSFPNTVSIKCMLISMSLPFLNAKLMGMAYRNTTKGICANQGNARCEDAP